MKRLNHKGFTLIELLAVIIILSIIMTIAIPNIVSTLDRNKRDTYIADAKKFLTLAKAEVASNINKPTDGEIVKIKLSCVDNQDLTKDPDGNPYNEEDSFVIVVRKNEELVYYVNLVAPREKGGNKGIELVEKSLLDTDDRMQYIKKNFAIPDDDAIRQKTGVSGQIRTCSN